MKQADRSAGTYLGSGVVSRWLAHWRLRGLSAAGMPGSDCGRHHRIAAGAILTMLSDTISPKLSNGPMLDRSDRFCWAPAGFTISQLGD